MIAMANESERPTDESPDLGATEDAPARPARRHRPWPWIVAAVIISPIAVIVLWTAIALNYSSSRGNRAGYVQKFSRKGWICKTWEGELAMVNLPGTMPELFRFSVRDDAVAQRINQSLGQRVRLHYEQHKGVPTNCFGET